MRDFSQRWTTPAPALSVGRSVGARFRYGVRRRRRRQAPGVRAHRRRHDRRRRRNRGEAWSWREGRKAAACCHMLPYCGEEGRRKREGWLLRSPATLPPPRSLIPPSLSPLLSPLHDDRWTAAAAGDHCHRPSPLPAPPVLAWFCAGKTSQLSAGICGRDISPSSLPSPRVSGRRRRRQRRPRVIPPRLRIIPAAIIASLSTEGTPSYVQCHWIQ